MPYDLAQPAVGRIAVEALVPVGLFRVCRQRDRRLEDLQKAYNDVVAQLRSAYTITYASNSVSSSPRVRVRTNRDGASVRLSPVVELNTP